ncbi:MAG: transcriptional regulator, AraC family [Thermoleophilia bacterium]|nr:transcriptional regulator, AraC family [Thermoleophilia bacterium]
MSQPIERQLLRARDLVDRRYRDPIDVDDMARAAGYSRAHFTREFKRTFGETPRAYLLTRRLERAAALLRTTDWQVQEVCWAVGLTSVASFNQSFARAFATTPTQWRTNGPDPRRAARIPACVLREEARPRWRSTSGQAGPRADA